jgi:hypothetical protein
VSGTSATVTATPAANYQFVNWTVNGTPVSSSTSYSFTVMGNETLVANFLPFYTISTSSNPVTGGTSSGSGTYVSGTTATVTATPAANYQFVNWTVNGTPVSNSTSYSFTVMGNETLVANFLPFYTISTSSAPVNGGTTSGAGTYVSGTSATVTATPAANCQFVNWTVNGTPVSSSTSYSFTVMGNETLVANFLPFYTISTSSNPVTGGTSGGGGTYVSGSTATVTATPNTGYTFLNWTINGNLVSTSSNYSFTVKGNETLVANFTNLPTSTISTSSAPVNGGTTSGAGTYLTGTIATVMATPAANYQFVNWTVNGTPVCTSTSYSFTVTDDDSLVANFLGIPVIAVQQPAGASLTSGSATVNFAIVTSGSTAQRAFTVLNNGAGNLTSLAASITGTNATEFQAAAPGASTLSPGSSTTLTVTYSPANIHTSAATLHITSNDPVTPSFDIILTASGTSGPINLKVGAGTYVGLIDASGTGAGTAFVGYVNLTLVKTGKVTGKLLFGGTTFAVTGVVDGSGNFKGKPSSLGLLLSSGSGGESNPAGYWMDGSITGQDEVSSFQAYHAAYGKGQVALETGKYTVLLNGADTSASFPQGTGYATLSIAKTGGVTLVGKLADGSPFTYSSFIVSAPVGHQVLVFDSNLYKKKGLVVGPITFEPLSDTDCDGVLQWSRPAIPGSFYPQGFNTTLDLGGAHYLKPLKGSAPLPFLSGTFTLSDGGLAAPISVSVILPGAPHNTLGFGSNDNNLKLSINLKTGGFAGSFTLPSTKKPIPFSGMLYQNVNNPGAEGFFISPILSGTSLSGNVLLSP